MQCCTSPLGQFVRDANKLTLRSRQSDFSKFSVLSPSRMHDQTPPQLAELRLEEFTANLLIETLHASIACTVIRLQPQLAQVSAVRPRCTKTRYLDNH